jgi:hypothetical protein
MPGNQIRSAFADGHPTVGVLEAVPGETSVVHGTFDIIIAQFSPTVVIQLKVVLATFGSCSYFRVDYHHCSNTILSTCHAGVILDQPRFGKTQLSQSEDPLTKFRDLHKPLRGVKCAAFVVARFSARFHNLTVHDN